MCYSIIVRADLERQHITAGEVVEHVKIRQSVDVLATSELVHVLTERRKILNTIITFH